MFSSLVKERAPTASKNVEDERLRHMHADVAEMMFANTTPAVVRPPRPCEEAAWLLGPWRSRRRRAPGFLEDVLSPSAGLRSCVFCSGKDARGCTLDDKLPSLILHPKRRDSVDGGSRPDGVAVRKAAGVKEARNPAFVLVAGGLGERLGYEGIKEKVACLADNDARLALDPNDKYKIQDTNGLLFNAIPSALGVSATKGYNVNSLAVPRKAKEAIGGITKLTHVDGRTMVINVEYNQLDPLLRATEHPDGDANCETGYSPYPRNINQCESISFGFVPSQPNDCNFGNSPPPLARGLPSFRLSHASTSDPVAQRSFSSQEGKTATTSPLPTTKTGDAGGKLSMALDRGSSSTTTSQRRHRQSSKVRPFRPGYAFSRLIMLDYRCQVTSPLPPPSKPNDAALWIVAVSDCIIPSATLINGALDHRFASQCVFKCIQVNSALFRAQPFSPSVRNKIVCRSSLAFSNFKLLLFTCPQRAGEASTAPAVRYDEISPSLNPRAYRS
ncbi:hypothetical protein ZWY2020_040001 [Hordeum vulgare]|nr:hypothetical protein ZWY2020_040001 [Hordeum vulgare]